MLLGWAVGPSRVWVHPTSLAAMRELKWTQRRTRVTPVTEHAFAPFSFKRLGWGEFQLIGSSGGWLHTGGRWACTRQPQHT